MGMKNYYNVLGTKQTDSIDTIKQAYRKLAKKYHPDRNPGDKIAEAKMREIVDAWQVLGDEQKRKAYDQELTGVKDKTTFTPEQSSTKQPSRPMTQEDFFHMSKIFDGVLNPEAIRNSAKQNKSQPTEPIDTAGFFEHVAGFKIPKKKAGT